MKAIRFSIPALPAIIRWTCGFAMIAVIIGGSCFVFPAIRSHFAALVLTVCLAILVGLQVALPPINPEDDWIRLGSGGKKEKQQAEETSQKAPAQPIATAYEKPHVFVAFGENFFHGSLQRSRHKTRNSRERLAGRSVLKDFPVKQDTALHKEPASGSTRKLRNN